MGCASSRFNNNGLLFPIKARPAFLHRLDEIKTRRNSQTLANTTFSKKELLLHDKQDDDINVHSSGGQEPCTRHSRKSSFSPEGENESCVKSEGSENVIKEFPEKVGDPAAGNDTANIVDKKSDKVIQSEHKSSELRAKGSKLIENSATCDSEIDEEDCLDERKLRRKDKDLGFPGSPSFRVYFNNNNPGDNSHKDLEDYPQDTAKVDDPVSQEVEAESVPPQEKKQKRRRSFKKVLPRGGQAAMKNLLNVRSCMSSSHNSTHDHTHLLTPKTPA